MSVRPIVIHGAPVLHRRAAEVKNESEESLNQLLADMEETLEASNGVGLAAPQVGVGLRVFLWNYDGDTGGAPSRGAIINPSLRLIGKVSQDAPDPDQESEGCLSVPGYNFPLKRSDHVEVSGFDPAGNPLRFEVSGWFARIMQHEYDHLDGYLYVNRLNDRYAKRWKKAVKKEGWNVAGNSWLPGTDPDPFGHDDGDDD